MEVDSRLFCHLHIKTPSARQLNGCDNESSSKEEAAALPKVKCSVICNRDPKRKKKSDQPNRDKKKRSDSKHSKNVR